MAIKPTMRTTMTDIGAYSVAELREFCSSRGLSKSGSKSELCERVWQCVYPEVTKLRMDHEELLLEQARRQQAALERDRADEISQAVIRGAVRGMDRIVKKCGESITKFQELVAKGQIRYAIEWAAGPCFESEFLLHEVCKVRDNLLQDGGRTTAQKLELLQEEITGQTDALINRSPRGGSTCEWTNVRYHHEFIARQSLVKILRNLKYSMTKALEQTEPKHAELYASSGSIY